MSNQPRYSSPAARVVEAAVPAGLMLVVPLGLYLLAAVAASGADHRCMAEVVCFDPARAETMSPGRMLAAAVMAAAAVAFLFVVPGLLGSLAFMRLPATRSTAHAWSLAANSAAVILIFLLLRHTVGIHRVSLIAAWLIWTVLLFIMSWRPGETRNTLDRLRKRYGAGLVIGFVAVLVTIVIFFPEQFIQCMSEDGTETCQLARSLHEHALPYWELDTWEPIPGGRMGTVVVNPSLVNSYWTCALQTLAGDGEPATRLTYWVWWMAILSVAYRLVRPAKGSWIAAVPLALTVFLAAVLFTFYVGYNPYMADLANPGVPNALFTLSVVLAFDCLRKKDRWGFVLSMTLALLVLYAGVVLLVLVLATAWWWQAVERKEILRMALRSGGLLVAVVACYAAYGWFDGSLSYWIETLDIEYVNDYLASAPRWISGPLFAGYFVLGCGGVTVLGLLWAFRRTAWQRTVATTTLLYLLIVLCSGFKNLHYLGPLLPIPVILYLMPAAGREMFVPWKKCAVATGSLIACIVLCWPAARPAFTLNRQLGEQTTIAADDYLTAARWARLRYTMKENGTMSWDCDQHTWVTYSQLDGLKHPRPLVLTGGGPPAPAYRLIASQRLEQTDVVVRLYARDERWVKWLATRRPLRPLERYPAVFRPLADGVFSPHNNTLEDVPRLRWPW